MWITGRQFRGGRGSNLILDFFVISFLPSEIRGILPFYNRGIVRVRRKKEVD